MTDRPDRQRVRPTAEGQARLLADIAAVGTPHAVDPGTLGEYAELLVVRGRAQADALLPEVTAHLATGCEACTADVQELTALLAEPDEPVTANRSSPRPEGLPQDATSRPGDASGIHAAELPDPLAAEHEAARRQRLRKIRDWLLIAAAASIALIGLSLVAIAYTSREQSGPARLGLTPLPATAPGQPAAPPGSSGQPGLVATAAPALSTPVLASPGRAAPVGMACPDSHPIKGNRESKLYHRPGGVFYAQTRPEVCFAAPADAEADGYRASQR